MSESQESQDKVKKQDIKFLTDNLPIVQMPDRFSFPDDFKFGFLAIKKWGSFQKENLSEDSEEKEVSAVIFETDSGKIKIRELSVGGVGKIFLDTEDLTELSDTEIKEELDRVPIPNDVARLAGGNYIKFLLIPSRYKGHVNHISNRVAEVGKKILGNVHTHPPKNPPSEFDFASFLFGGDRMEIVISNDELYVFVRGKEGYKLSNMKEYVPYIRSLGQKYRSKMKATNGNSQDPRGFVVQALIEECSEKRIAFYTGHLSENTYHRLV